MFPTELMMLRKSKDGVVRPVFLTSESTDYCVRVLDLFKSCINCKRSEIEDRLKVLELKSQNPKYVKGLALILFRNSSFEPASTLDAEEVRASIFKEARRPVISPEQKAQVLERVSRIYNVSAQEIENAMYADKESEAILKKVYSTDPDSLARQFNLEQLETILLKSLDLKISEARNWQVIFKKVKSLGLLYHMDMQNNELASITVSGPVSVLEQTERYGAKLALLLRFLISIREWHIDARVVLKDSSKVKKEYVLSLSSTVSYYLPSIKASFPVLPKLKYKIIEDPAPVIIDNQIFFADYSVTINNRTVYIDISRVAYLDQNRELRALMKSHNYNWEIFYYLEGNERQVKGELCFKNDLDWSVISDYLAEKYDKKPDSDDTLRSDIASLYPDSDRIIEYLESHGYVPDQVLRRLGYRFRWNGLKLELL